MRTRRNNLKLAWLFSIALLALNFTAPGQQFLDVVKATHPNFSCKTSDELEKRVMNGYGAMFVSKDAALPKSCLFRSEEEVTAFQCKIKGMNGSKLKDIDFYLQPQAAAALERVFLKIGGWKKVARNYNGTTVTRPNGLSDDWAMRTLRQTQCNWVGAGADAKKCDDAIMSNSFTPAKIMTLINANSKHMFSYAIPGGSQHHFGLAIDVNDESWIKPEKISKIRLCGNDCVKALNDNGWYRTIPTDRYHFTYLGYTDPTVLRSKGLKQTKCGNLVYWVPDLPADLANKFISSTNCTDGVYK